MAGRSASSLWMGDIDQYMDERVIAEAFSMMGEHVLSVKLLKDHKTGQNRNYCFVELTSKEAVGLALRRLTGLPLPNYPAKRFKLNFSLREQQIANFNPAQSVATPQGGGASSQFPYGREYSIYVGNLNTSTTDEELLALFAHYKSLKEAKVVRDESQKSKGFGFVRFFSETDQEAAIIQMNGAVGPMGVTLLVNKAMPKKDLNAGGMMPMSTGATAAAMANQFGSQYGYQGGMNPYAGYNQMAQAQSYQQQPQGYQQPAQAAMASAAHTTTPAAQTPTPQAAATPAATPAQPAKNEEDDETLEDHSAPVNMVATNLAYIQANQDFYKKLAECRWHPVTSYSATIEEVCK